MSSPGSPATARWPVGSCAALLAFGVFVVFVAAPLRGMVYLALVLVSSLSVLRVDLREILLCLGAATVFYV